MDAPEREKPDRIESLVAEALGALALTEGLVGRVMASLPSRDEMRPALHGALRAAFGLTAAVFATSPWTMNLPLALGPLPPAARAGLAAAFLGAALGAAVVAFALARESLPHAAAALRSLAAGRVARPLAATAGAAAVLAAAWAFLGWFPDEALVPGLRAARSSAATLAAVLAAAAAVQIALAARSREIRRALGLLEAVSLAAVCLACLANYVIFVA